MTVFPVLRDWITEFFDKNKFMVASDVGHNMLIEQVIIVHTVMSSNKKYCGTF